MNASLQALAVLLPVGYVVCAILHGMAFGGPRAPQVRGLRAWISSATIALHLAYFAVRANALHSFPVSDLWSTVSAIVLVSALLHRFLARSVGQASSGGVVLGIAALLQIAASARADLAPIARAEPLGAFAIVHVVTSVIAAATLLLSGVHGVLYLLLLREMRERRFGALFDHLPDLDQLARLMRGAALAGFLCLAIGVNVGIALAHAEKSPGFAYRDAEVLLSIVLWLHFGAIAFSRHVKGFNARRASIAAAGGLLVLLLSFVLVLFPTTTFHSGL